MFTRSTVILALFSTAARLAVATPPACLVAAVNTCPDPSDLKAVCNNATKVERYISSNCGNNVQSAMADFKSVCSSAGVTIPTSAASSLGSASSTGTGTGTRTSTASRRLIISGVSGSAFATGTRSPSAFATGVLTSPAPGPYNGILSTTPGVAGPTASGGSGAGSSASPSGSSTPLPGSAARLSMHVVGLIAVGAFGAILAM